MKEYGKMLLWTTFLNLYLAKHKSLSATIQENAFLNRLELSRNKDDNLSDVIYFENLSSTVPAISFFIVFCSCESINVAAQIWVIH